MAEPVAVVTGHTGGIGSAVAGALGDAGYWVVGASLHGDPPVDVTKADQVRRFARRVLRDQGAVEALVNCAGVDSDRAPLPRQSAPAFLACYRANVLGPFYTMRELLPPMVARGRGSVVNVASRAALIPWRNLAPYSSSKAALVSLTRTAAAELEGTGVSCVAVCPGATNTPMAVRRNGRTYAAGLQSPGAVGDAVARVVRGAYARSGDVVVVHGGKAEIVPATDGGVLALDARLPEWCNPP